MLTTQQKIDKCRELDDRTEYTLYICGNEETLLDGTYLASNGRDGREEVCNAYQAADRYAFDNGRSQIVTKCESQFRDWHGGRFCQFYAKHGLVACPKGAPAWVHELASKVDDVLRQGIATLDDKCREYDELHQGEDG